MLRRLETLTKEVDGLVVGLDIAQFYDTLILPDIFWYCKYIRYMLHCISAYIVFSSLSHSLSLYIYILYMYITNPDDPDDQFCVYMYKICVNKIKQ